MCMLSRCVDEGSAIPVTFSVCMCAHKTITVRVYCVIMEGELLYMA